LTFNHPERLGAFGVASALVFSRLIHPRRAIPSVSARPPSSGRISNSIWKLFRGQAHGFGRRYA